MKFFIKSLIAFSIICSLSLSSGYTMENHNHNNEDNKLVKLLENPVISDEILRYLKFPDKLNLIDTCEPIKKIFYENRGFSQEEIKQITYRRNQLAHVFPNIKEYVKQFLFLLENIKNRTLQVINTSCRIGRNHWKMITAAFLFTSVIISIPILGRFISKPSEDKYRLHEKWEALL